MTDSNKHTPLLRFPEFLNDGEWCFILLKDAINKVTPPQKLPSSEYKTNGQFPIVDQSASVPAGYSDDQTALLNTQNEDYIVFGDHTCTIKLINYPFIQGADGIKIFRSKRDDLNTQYLYYYLLAHPIISKEYKRHFADLTEKSILFPRNLKEQIRIADCFSSIDKQIAATKSKLEQLKEHKRGLMQRLFPARGKTVPELRFHEFRNAGEWNNKKLGECLLQSPDYGLNSPAVPYNPLLNTYLRITDISENGRFISETKVSVDATLTDDNSLHDGDIVLARTGASVGKSYKYRKEDGTLIFAGFLIRIKPNTTKYNSEFIFQYLQTDIYRNWVNITSARSGQPGINSNEYSSLSIPFPSLNEQQKIAECLMSIDELIRLYESKVTLLDQHKKGLMQQLFPKL